MSTRNYDAVVIGAGPGGYVCAIRLAQLGVKTACIEKDNPGGVCLNVGCIPSKALIHAAKHYYHSKNELGEMGITVGNVSLDMGKMISWKADVVKKLTGGVAQMLKMNGVDSIKGNAVFKDAKTLEVTTEKGKETVTAKNIVIATGSRIIEIPSFPFDGKTILNSTDALALTQLPKKMIVIGGGYIGLELGMVYAKLGTEVTVVEALDRVLATVDKELTAVVEKQMRKLGMKVYASAKALGVKGKGPVQLEIETADKKRETLEADVVLVSVGRKPNSDGLGLDKVGMKLDAKGNIETNHQGQTNVPGVWAIGDVSGPPQLAHRAMMDGMIVAANISGHKEFKDYKTVPWVIFTDPEVAGTGLTEAEIQAKGLKYRIGKVPFAANGRALSTNEGVGFVKMFIEEKTEQILGVYIVGPEASNLIAEATLAIEMGAVAEDIMHTIHAHPTLAEVIPETVEAAFYKSIHIFKPAPATGGASSGRRESVSQLEH